MDQIDPRTYKLMAYLNSQLKLSAIWSPQNLQAYKEQQNIWKKERRKERRKASSSNNLAKCIHIYSKPNDGCLKNQSMQAKNLIFFCKIFDSCLFVGKQHTRTEIENYDTSSIVMFQRVKKRKTNCSSEDEVKKPKRLKFSFLHWEYSVIIDLLVCYSEHPSRITVLGKGTLICPKKTCPSKWS